ncbi:MAG: hypothetical protein PHZ09_01920 [Eubacteriales bacterium]|jgi:energy-coupling factor transport system substrate-specific component|nr:hypothetical protein [Eubacteriales bacterium]
MQNKNSAKIREIIIIALMSAVLYGVQVAIAFLPNVELVSLLIIIYSLVFGYKVFFIIGVFVIAEGLTYGFGIWWISYLYVWPILAIVALLLKRNRSVIIWAFISGLFGLMFGFLCSFPYFFVGGPQMAFSYWVAGIMFDVIHCVFNFVIVLVLFKPVLYMLTKLYAPYREKKNS